MHGVYYLRITRKVTDKIFEDGSKFEIGKAVTLKKGADITLIASGFCTSDTLKAAEELKKHGIDAEVLNIFTQKPIDAQSIIDSARKTGAVITT